MLRACLVSLPAAPVVDHSIRGNIGGTETRAWLFARFLAKQPDTEVTFVVRHREPLPREQYDGVHVLTRVDPLFNLYEQVGMCVERVRGFPYLKLRRWRTSLLWQLPWLMFQRWLSPRGSDPRMAESFFSDIAADVFCTFGVQSNSARVIASAHAAGRRAVLVLGSDGDLDPRFLKDPDYVNPYGDRAGVCRWILEQADAIVCQTKTQAEMLRQHFGREGTVIGNPIDLADWDRKCGGRCPVDFDRFVLWIGRAESVHKRPMHCIEVAKRSPGIRFVLVMNPRDAEEEARVRAAAPSNVTILDYVSPENLPALMSRALVLLNTSSLEGFSNAFLQAGAARVPVVSLVVGQDFLTQSGGGSWAAENVDCAAEIIRDYATDEPLRNETGDRGRKWVTEHHDAARQAGVLHGVLLETSRQSGSMGQKTALPVERFGNGETRG